ncbi:MAG: phosphate signaling complex protein PhoU [bacterium]
MTKYFQKEIEQLKKRVLHLTAKVEESLQMAVSSVEDLDANLAAQVVAGDAEIDRLEVELEEECLKNLALHQPVAIDLRFLVAALKINSDLERIADLAVNIAEEAIRLAKFDKVVRPYNLTDMLNRVMWMVHKSADSLVNLDPELGRAVCAADNEVDQLHRDAAASVVRTLKRHPEQAPALISLLDIARNLERIADHATNIAEDVIYMVNGEIIRHQGGE